MNLILGASAGVAILIGAALFFSFRVYRKPHAMIRASLEERDRLYAELQHRVKNSLATIASLIGIEQSRLSDGGARSVLETRRGRVETLASLYRIMHQGETQGVVDLPNYLRDISHSISQGMGSPTLSLGFESRVSELNWDAKRASSIGLILNELVTNAVKHAVVTTSDAVRIRLEQTNEKLILEVSNPAAPLPPGFSPEHGEGFGLVMVNELVRQLGGSLEVCSSEGRVFFSMRISL